MMVARWLDGRACCNLVSDGQRRVRLGGGWQRRRPCGDRQRQAQEIGKDCERLRGDHADDTKWPRAPTRARPHNSKTDNAAQLPPSLPPHCPRNFVCLTHNSTTKTVNDHALQTLCLTCTTLLATNERDTRNGHTRNGIKRHQIHRQPRPSRSQ